jgi:hypothetical protein
MGPILADFGNAGFLERFNSQSKKKKAHLLDFYFSRMVNKVCFIILKPVL